MEKSSLKTRINESLKRLSVRRQLSLSFALTIAIILIVNIIVFLIIDAELKGYDEAYSSNKYNSSFSDKIDEVQVNLTDYALTKSSISMEEYYKKIEDLKKIVDNINYSEIDEKVWGMQKDLVMMTQEYIVLTNETVQNKRGGNIQKYKESYDKATKMYSYIKDYLYSVNIAQFQLNNDKYAAVKSSMHYLEITSILIIVLVTCCTYTLLSFFASRVTGPIAGLAKNAKEISDGNFNVEINSQDREDEIGVLSRTFKKMLVSIKEYMENEKRNIEEKRDIRERELKLEAKAKDAELKYFQAQTDPHFLFNTLNAGMQLAMLEGAPKTCSYVENVAKFFRYNLKKDDGITLIEDELKLVDYYVAILDVRFGGEIRLIKDIDESLIYTQIPKMVIQPLIENSVNHGIRDMEGKGMIFLSVYKEDENCVISVADNGKGMDEDLKAKILDGAYVKEKGDNNGNGVGLINIISRLKLFYNKEDVVEFPHTGENSGFEVVIRIPLNKQRAQNV